MMLLNQIMMLLNQIIILLNQIIMLLNKKHINEYYRTFGHNITIIILNQYDFEKINKWTPEKL